MKRKLKETAVAGTVSAHSIATNPFSGGGESNETKMHKRNIGLKDFMLKFNSRLKNKLDYKPVKPFKVTINEEFSLDQIFSKLRGIENQATKRENSVTYGVEDDNGNIMKITVNSEQSSDFEAKLAELLGELEQHKKTGRGYTGSDISLAEILYTLKNEFNILDVEFPEIPKDVVYNADKISKPEELEDMGDNMEPPGEGMGDDEFDPSLDGDNNELDEPSPEEGEGVEGEEGEGDELSDDESVEDFDELGADEEDEEKSALKSIIDMLKADAEARAAEANARAEEYRAKQAEYSAKAAKNELENQEEVLSMEQEMEQEKEKEKRAKKLADLAKYKMKKASDSGSEYSFGESLSFGDFLCEFDDFDNEQSIRRQIAVLPQKFSPEPNESQESRNHKRAMMNLHRRVLNLKLQMVRLRDKRKAQEDQDEQQQQQNRQQDPRQQQQAQQRGTQPQQQGGEEGIQ